MDPRIASRVRPFEAAGKVIREIGAPLFAPQIVRFTREEASVEYSCSNLAHARGTGVYIITDASLSRF